MSDEKQNLPEQVPVNAITPQLLREKIGALRDVVAPGASNSQLAVFASICVMQQLNPFTKDIYWSTDLKQPLISRDGYMKLAKRGGRMEMFQSAVVYEGEEFEATILDGVPHVKHTQSLKAEGQPIGAWALCRLKGYEVAFYAFAPWASHARPTPVWKQFPAQMILKSAERIVLRKAYGDPEESGDAPLLSLSVEELDAQAEAFQADDEGFKEQKVAEAKEERQTAREDAEVEKAKFITDIEKAENALSDAGWDAWNIKKRRLGSRTKHIGTTDLGTATVGKLSEYKDHLDEALAAFDAALEEKPAADEGVVTEETVEVTSEPEVVYTDTEDADVLDLFANEERPPEEK